MTMDQSIDTITNKGFEQYKSLVKQRDELRAKIPDTNLMVSSAIAMSAGTVVLGGFGKWGYVVGGAATIYALYGMFKDRRKNKTLYNTIDAAIEQYNTA